MARGIKKRNQSTQLPWSCHVLVFVWNFLVTRSKLQHYVRTSYNFQFPKHAARKYDLSRAYSLLDIKMSEPHGHAELDQSMWYQLVLQMEPEIPSTDIMPARQRRVNEDHVLQTYQSLHALGQ
jgi:hypothetical protein